MQKDMAIRIVHGYTQQCLKHGLIPKEGVIVWSKSRIEADQGLSGTLLRIEGPNAIVDFQGETIPVPLSDLIIANAVREMEYHETFGGCGCNEELIIARMVEYSTTPDGIGGGYIMSRKVWAND